MSLPLSTSAMLRGTRLGGTAAADGGAAVAGAGAVECNITEAASIGPLRLAAVTDTCGARCIDECNPAVENSDTSTHKF